MSDLLHIRGRPRVAGGWAGGRRRGQRVSGSAGGAPHGPGDEVVADLHFAHDLEPVSLVEGHVADVAGLEVGAEALPIALRQDLAYQGRADALALRCSGRAEHEQIEVGLVVRMRLRDSHQPCAYL